MSAGAGLAEVMRVRRHQPTRLEGFVDASFAFAVTLVVISIGRVPDDVPQMLQALRGVPTFAACFALIARTWKSHRDWSRYYDLEDGTTIVLSLLLVFLVLIYVYPLHLLFTLMFAALSGGWLMEREVDVRTVFELRAAYIVFGVGYAAIWLVQTALNRHAYRLRDAIGLDAAEQASTRMRFRITLSFCLIALLSATLAALLPFEQWPSATSLPGSAYLLMIPAAAVLRRRCRRDIAALPPVSVQ